MKAPLLERLQLDGLEVAPPQLLGNVRLFPVVDPEPGQDLRLGLRDYEQPHARVELRQSRPKADYFGYVPHGLVVSWADGSEAEASYGAGLVKPSRRERRGVTQGLHTGMVRREGSNQLRLLPLHLAVEGFLSLHFGGPSIRWADYSRVARDHGLGYRALDDAVPGSRLDVISEALSIFEIHENQVGVLIFVSDALFNTFVTSHPDDYRLLHRSLIEDLYADLIVHYAEHGHAGNLELTLNSDQVVDLGTLERACTDLRQRWERQAEQMTSGLLDRPLEAERIYKLGPFTLQRFATDFTPDIESHIGEAITDQQGHIRYLKTFRLSKTQTRRAALLRLLADNEWDIAAAAASQGAPLDEFLRRIDNLGFGYLVNTQFRTDVRRGAISARGTNLNR